MPIETPYDPSNDQTVLARRNPGDVYGFDNPQNDPSNFDWSRPDLAFLTPAANALESVAGTTAEVVVDVALGDLLLFAGAGLASVATGIKLAELNQPVRTPVETPYDPANDVTIGARRPPTPPGFSTVAGFEDQPPNWADLADPGNIVFPQGPSLVDRLVDLVDRFGGTLIDVLTGRYDDLGNQLFPQAPTVPLPRGNTSTEIIDLPPAVSPIPQPVGAPGTIAQPGWLADPSPFPQPGTAPSPFVPPLVNPLPFPAPLTTPQPAPRPIPTPSPLPGWLFDPAPGDIGDPSTSIGTGTDTLFGVPPDLSPLTPFEPGALDSPQVPGKADNCPPCVQTREKPKQKKKRKPRSVCYEGKYREYANGTSKFSKVEVPCEPKPKERKKRVPGYRRPRVPGTNPFPGVPDVFRGP